MASTGRLEGDYLYQLNEVTLGRITKDSSGKASFIPWEHKHINTSIYALQVTGWIIVVAIAISTSVWLYGEFKNSALSLPLVASILTSGQLIRSVALLSAGVGMILATQLARVWLFLRSESLKLQAVASTMDVFRKGVEFENAKLSEEAHAAFSCARLMSFYGASALDELLKKRTGN
jgi:hypothetical protein